MGVWLRHPAEQIDIIAGESYSRLFRVNGQAVILTIENSGTVSQPSCIVAVKGEDFPGRLEWAENTTRALLNDDVDIQRFYQHLEEEDPELYQGIQFLRGLKPVQTPTLFETLVFAIVGQQVNVNFAYQCRVALENKYAWKTSVDGENRVLALAPEDLYQATVEDLRQLKISGNKAKSIIRLSQAFMADELQEVTDLKLLDEEVLDKLLLSQFGIGPWTVEYSKIRALGYLDSLPSGDAGLRAAIAQFYGYPEKLTPDKIEKIAEKWRPYRSWATYYLWTWLGQREKNKKKQ